MKIYKAGTEVEFKTNNVKGIITGVLIRRNDIEYYVRYLSGSSFEEGLFADYEFIIKRNKPNVGFGSSTELTKIDDNSVNLNFE